MQLFCLVHSLDFLLVEHLFVLLYSLNQTVIADCRFNIVSVALYSRVVIVETCHMLDELHVCPVTPVDQECRFCFGVHGDAAFVLDLRKG